MGGRFVDRTIAALVVISGAAAVGVWSPTLFGWRAAQAAVSGRQPPDAVQVIPGGTERLGAKPGEKGTTYYSLEVQTARLTTEFLDGTRSVAERSADGTLKAVLSDADGNEIHRLRIDDVQSGAAALSYIRAGGQSSVYRMRQDVHPTLDWLNHQGHKLHQDRVATDTGLEWNDGFVRSKAARQSSSIADDEVRLTESEWANGLVARTAHVRATDGYEIGGRAIKGQVLATRLMRNGVDIGVANYFVGAQIYAWHLQDVPDGWIANEHLQPRYGGWSFRPDMVWMNLQTIAMFHWRTVIAQKGFVAKNGTCSDGRPGLAERISTFFAPVVRANEPGCDPPLHWLDGTIFRYCCDLHDACYEKSGCSSSTWWRWWSSWTCDFCNLNAVFCFADGGGTNHILIPCVC